MGLLDDAIREHLELKRRRGADPAEVEQQEREALGPVRGGAPAAASATAEAEAEAPAEPVHFDEPEAAHTQVHYDEPEDEGPDLFDAQSPEVPPLDDEPVSQPTQQFSVEDLPAEEPAAPPRAHDDVVAADEEPDGEDVLDETPEFLQEAPEHDRLWFEQKPPRDFDF